MPYYFWLYRFLLFVTNFGNSSFLGAISMLAIIYLVGIGCYEEAKAIGFAFIIASCIIAIMKIQIIGCGGLLSHEFNIRSPSGHTCLSVAIFGTYTHLLANRLKGIAYFFWIMMFVLLVSLISISRVVLGYHTVGEIIVGVFVGGIVVVLSMWVFPRGSNSARFRVSHFAMILLLAAMGFYGTSLPSENVLYMLAMKWRGYTSCQRL